MCTIKNNRNISLEFSQNTAIAIFFYYEVLILQQSYLHTHTILMWYIVETDPSRLPYLCFNLSKSHTVTHQMHNLLHGFMATTCIVWQFAHHTIASSQLLYYMYQQKNDHNCNPEYNYFLDTVVERVNVISKYNTIATKQCSLPASSAPAMCMASWPITTQLMWYQYTVLQPHDSIKLGLLYYCVCNRLMHSCYNYYNSHSQ